MNFNFHRAYSLPVKEFSRQLLHQYDANGNGQIDLRPVLQNRGRPESSRLELDFAENPTLGDAKRLSRGNLFKDVDRQGNRDGVVDGPELQQFLDRYDSNQDGELDGRGLKGLRKGHALGELDLFNRDYPEEQD